MTRDEQVAIAAETLGLQFGFASAEEIPSAFLSSFVEDAEAVVAALEARGGVSFGPRA